MAYVDHTSFAKLTPASLTLGLRAAVAQLLNLHAAPADSEGQSFTRIKSAQLPAVEACQSSIFRELRVREDSRTPRAATSGSRAGGIFDLRICLSGLIPQRWH
jgi:hypothetical protein